MSALEVWTLGWRETLSIGAHTAALFIVGEHDDGAPAFDLQWSTLPARLEPDDITRIMRWRRVAEERLAARWFAQREASR